VTTKIQLEKPTRVTIWGPLPEKMAGFRHVLVGIVMALLLPTVLTLIAAYGQNPALSASKRQAELTAMFSTGPGAVVSLALLWIGLLFGVWLASRVTSGGWRALVDWSISWRKDLPIGIGLGIALQGLGILAGLVVQHFTQGRDLSNSGEILNVTGIWFPIMSVAGCVGAPIVEEIFFRGLALNVLFRKFGTTAAITITSLMFGLMHIQSTVASSIYTVISTTLVGVAFATTRLRTGRLGTSIVMHITFNSVAVLLSLLIK
jgi:membrane protease YdiL (CAAX protease family)